MKRLILLLCACFAAGVGADVIILKDGTTLEGKIKRSAEGFVVTDAAGKVTTVAAGDVQSMKPDKVGGGAGGARASGGTEQDLASLRKSVAGAREPRQAIERYKNFIARDPQGAVAAEAAKDLAEWQGRADRGLVKVGDEWLTPEQLTERQQQAAKIAAQAAPLIAAGNFADAGVMVDKALQASPNNPDLQYLKGVMLFRQGQKVPARKAFEAVEAALPEHMPTHNNLAVILWQTRAQMPAIGEYEKAMLAEPDSQAVLDNLAEALHELPPTAAKNEMVKRVAARFVQQDGALQKKMLAERGLKRLGSQWIAAAEFDAMQATRKAAQEKMDGLRKEATDLPLALNQLDREISIRTDTMRAMQQQSTVIDAYGHIVQQPVPQHYYELKQEAEAKSAERAFKQRRLDQLPKLMAEAQQQLSSQEKYTGKQRLIEEAGMPGAPKPATQPAARPS